MPEESKDGNTLRRMRERIRAGGAPYQPGTGTVTPTTPEPKKKKKIPVPSGITPKNISWWKKFWKETE